MDNFANIYDLDIIEDFGLGQGDKLDISAFMANYSGSNIENFISFDYDMGLESMALRIDPLGSANYTAVAKFTVLNDDYSDLAGLIISGNIIV